MMVHLSRQARRRMERATGSAEPAIQADARYFARFPARSHRIRLAHRAEVEQFSVIAGHPVPALGPGQVAFALIRQVAPGVRLKAVIAGPATDAGEDHPEAFAAGLWAEWRRMNPSIAEQEARLETAARQPGGPLHDPSNRGVA